MSSEMFRDRSKVRLEIVVLLDGMKRGRVMELGGSLGLRRRGEGTGHSRIKESEKAVLPECATAHIKRTK